MLIIVYRDGDAQPRNFISIQERRQERKKNLSKGQNHSHERAEGLGK